MRELTTQKWAPTSSHKTNLNSPSPSPNIISFAGSHRHTATKGYGERVGTERISRNIVKTRRCASQTLCHFVDWSLARFSYSKRNFCRLEVSNRRTISLGDSGFTFELSFS